jgi:hypothetical protein
MIISLDLPLIDAFALSRAIRAFSFKSAAVGDARGERLFAVADDFLPKPKRVETLGLLLPLACEGDDRGDKTLEFQLASSTVVVVTDNELLLLGGSKLPLGDASLLTVLILDVESRV